MDEMSIETRAYLVVERNEGGAVGWMPVKGLCHADLTAPARLVEVSP
jgi:hypothetical protein